MREHSLLALRPYVSPAPDAERLRPPGHTQSQPVEHWLSGQNAATMAVMTAEPTDPPADLAAWQPAQAPEHRILLGERVRLEPVDPGRCAQELFVAGHGHGSEPDVWRYLPYGPFADVGELRGWLDARARSRDPLFLTVIDLATGRAGGVVSFLRPEPAHGSVEIGHIWFGADLQRTPQATEVIFLLASHAFEDLGNRRLEWKCNAANARSRRAAQRFGFSYEGVFRQHMIVKGRNRDTAWYSMLDSEWPAARSAFQTWLDPANFDADGRQRTSLATLRSSG